MKTEHTPGPWENAGHCCYSSMGRVISICPSEENPAGWNGGEYYGLENQATVVANSRLIAAAPDLLQALREIEEMRFQIIDGLKRANYPRMAVHDCFDAARAAIAKATGKQTT